MSQRSNYLAAALLAAMVIACGSSPQPKPGHDPIEARVVCHDFVKRQLKSPGSAEFSEETETGKGPTFTSAGVVDSQNSFGALIRNEYACTVTYQPDKENWRLVELTGLDN